MASNTLMSPLLLVSLLLLGSLAIVLSEDFSTLSNLNGNVCENTAVLSAYDDVSLFRCLTMCSRSGYQSCFGVFYMEIKRQCFLCRTMQNTTLQALEGTVAWKRETCSRHVYLVQNVTDEQLSESTTHYNQPLLYSASNARLDVVESPSLPGTCTGGWVAATNDPQPYIQVDFLGLKWMVGVETQGRSGYPFYNRQWTTEYYVMVSGDCSNWTYVRDRHGAIEFFPGNTDEDTHVTNLIYFRLKARCVRVYPTLYHKLAAMRFDVLGCDI